MKVILNYKNGQRQLIGVPTLIEKILVPVPLRTKLGSGIEFAQRVFVREGNTLTYKESHLEYNGEIVIEEAA